jgi:hypothetical protein
VEQTLQFVVLCNSAYAAIRSLYSALHNNSNPDQLKSALQEKWAKALISEGMETATAERLAKRFATSLLTAAQSNKTPS